ncbi:MAG: Stf0 sulfotransferase family protein [Actinomycetota bacterium]|nr:Stf0 sulfotransferase family protein [Actinomycetota bacterium]
MGGLARRRAQSAVRFGGGLAGPALAPGKRFVLFGTGRVGSELLMDLLNAHPDIVCDGEILTDDTLRHPGHLMEWRAVRARARGAKAYGFKLLTSQLRRATSISDPHAFLARLAARGDVIVLMERRNLLSVGVSFIQAETIGWHHRTDSDPPAGQQIEVDPIDAVHGVYALEEATAWNESVVEGIAHLRVVYEDDLEDPARQQSTVDTIVNALGLPSAPVSTELVRVVPRALRDRIANYDEVADVLSRTRYARYLDQPDPRVS